MASMMRPERGARGKSLPPSRRVIVSILVVFHHGLDGLALLLDEDTTEPRGIKREGSPGKCQGPRQRADPTPLRVGTCPEDIAGREERCDHRVAQGVRRGDLVTRTLPGDGRIVAQTRRDRPDGAD